MIQSLNYLMKGFGKMIEILLKQEKNRTVALDNNKIIGECDFVIKDNLWNIVHTIVNSSYQGQGIARKLVLCIIDKAKCENASVIAACSYAKKVLGEQNEI